ncbi:MAG: alkaline phosphatase family protein [Candidatus Omnitrophota bacterium]
MDPKKERSKKVFLLGFDGCTFNVINPMLKAGRLPNLAKVIKSGARAYLDSTIPPLTPVAWPGMFTGKLPGKTGVFDFSLPTGRLDKKTGQPEKKRVNSSFIKAKPIWQILSEKGKKCIVLDVPLAYPPSKINGVMISRVMSTRRTRTVYPAALYEKLKRRGLIYKRREKKEDRDIEGMHREIEKKRGKRKKLSPKERRLVIKERFQNLLDGIDEKVKLIKYLHDNYEWDFFMAVFMESDQAGHGFWKDRGKVEKVYQKLDEALGEIFSFLPEESLKFIASDHGFQSIRGHFSMNEWLAQKGLAKKTFEPDKESRKLLKNLARFKEDFRSPPGRPQKTFRYQAAVDHKNSRAYLWSGTSYGIRINLKGRDPEGVVEPRDYEKLRGRLMDEIKKIKEPKTDRKIFSKVLKKEEVIGAVPEEDSRASSDIYMLPSNMDYGVISFDRSGKLYRKKAGGFHRKEGIFFAMGDEIRKGFDAGTISILDVTPNILHALGHPVPCDADGKVRKEIFAEGSKSRKNVVEVGPSSQKKTKEKRLSGKDEEKIKKRLEALGYIE